MQRITSVASITSSKPILPSTTSRIQSSTRRITITEQHTSHRLHHRVAHDASPPSCPANFENSTASSMQNYMHCITSSKPIPPSTTSNIQSCTQRIASITSITEQHTTHHLHYLQQISKTLQPPACRATCSASPPSPLANFENSTPSRAAHDASPPSPPANFENSTASSMQSNMQRITFVTSTSSKPIPPCTASGIQSSTRRIASITSITPIPPSTASSIQISKRLIISTTSSKPSPPPTTSKILSSIRRI